VEVLCDLPNVDVEYTVTDLSYSLASRLAQSFSYKNMVAKMFDISRSPSEHGLQLGHYDIITGFNVLHAVPDLNSCLSNLHSLLSSDGCILAVDSDGAAYTSDSPRPGIIWGDFVWGSFQGWFGYTDDRDHCTIDRTAWQKRLTETGFSNIEICLEDAGMCILFKAKKA
jgi:fatty acid synthase